MSRTPYLVALVFALLLCAGAVFYAWTGHTALVDTLGPRWSWVLSLVLPDVAQGVGSYLYARDNWQWGWLPAVIYGFPGTLIILIPALICAVLWIGRAVRAGIKCLRSKLSS